MKPDEILREYWTYGILAIFTIMSIIISLFDPIFLLVGYAFLGCLVGWTVYSKGFLSIHIPQENTDKDRKQNFDYYSVDNWTKVDQKRGQGVLKGVILLVIMWVVFSVLLNTLGQIQGYFSSDIETWIDALVSILWMGLVGLVILLYLTVILTFILKRLPDELAKVFRGRMNQVIIITGIVLYLGIGFFGILFDHLSADAFLLGLLIFPAALFIIRIQGSFFYLFAIYQWFQVRNYSILEGKQLRESQTTSRWDQTKGILGQIRALIVIFIIPVSFISTLLAMIDFVSGNFTNDDPGLLETLISSIIPPELALVTLLLLSLGPLLVLLVKPFSFVEIWLNQGLYQKIASPWDLDTAGDNFDRYHSLFPFPAKQTGFRWSLFIAGTGVLTFFGLNLNASIAPSALPLIPSLVESLVLVGFVTNVIFLLTLIELTWDLIEERTLWIFGRESRNNNRDLVNYALYGEYLLFNNQPMDEYIQHNPPRWGLAWFMKGLNPTHANDDRLFAFEKALAKEQVLIPSVKPVAYNDYGVLLTKKGRLDEAEKAFETALKLLGKTPKKTPAITADLDDFAVPNMPVPQMNIAEPVPNMPVAQMEIEPVPNMPISQLPREEDFVAQSRPMAQMAPSGVSSGSSRSASSGNRRERRDSSLISFEELKALDSDESIRSSLEARYRRRPATKAAYNIEVIRQRREKMVTQLKTIKTLDAHLAANPDDIDKWIELAEACVEVNYVVQAKGAYEKARELLQAQGREDKIEEIENKLADL